MMLLVRGALLHVQKTTEQENKFSPRGSTRSEVSRLIFRSNYPLSEYFYGRSTGHCYMVAPTRTPQARGVKCDLCKNILSSATWLDQTKLAKEVQEAQAVLNLIKQHNAIECPCIPKNIENLLVGSTHFEIHRLVAKQLDYQVHKRQVECYIRTKQRVLSETPKNKKQILNDCYDNEKSSRFRIYPGYGDQKQVEQSKLQLKHLFLAIDYWQIAMEDQTNPFNSKLAHRLGLTHHVIYACYLFKYYKILDYQLLAANLLLNVFRSIEGVTANAVLHAHFILVKSLIECDQLQLARHYLKQATRLSNYSDKSHYESILLHSVACELNFLEGREAVYNHLDELAELAKIKPEDKLQHYYARTLAISILMKYIHYYPSRSEQCFEFFHAYRYVCAISRRCYESSFEIVLAEKELGDRQLKTTDPKHTQILDHSWIRYAVCDFVFSTFEHLAEFYARAGMPECLELLYNSLNLISFRNGGLYWQSKITSIGIRLDLLCDKYDDAKEKLDVCTRLVGYSDNQHLMNVLRLESEVSLMTLLNQNESVISRDVISDVIDRTRLCKSTFLDKISKIELFDLKSDVNIRLSSNHKYHTDDIILGGYLGSMTLVILKIGITSALREGSRQNAVCLIEKLKDNLEAHDINSLTYFDHQVILEMMLQLVEIDKSEQKLLDAVSTSQVFLKLDDGLSELQQQLSSLSLVNEPEKIDAIEIGSKKATRRGRSSKLSLGRASRRKGTYEVARTTKENETIIPSARLFGLVEALANISSLTKEEIVATYLRNSEPNPDYNLYRCAHELMLSFRLMDQVENYEVLLYHFTESITSNTMRYRWMMMEEQQLSPFDQSKYDPMNVDKPDGTTSLRQLGFCNILVNQEKNIKSMTRAIPDSFRLVQFRYIFEGKSELEHLLCVSFKSDNEPIFIHAKRAIESDDFFKGNDDKKADLTFLKRFSSAIEESKRSLLNYNHRTRSETRQRIETELGMILHDIENDWLGPFRFVMCADINDTRYIKFIDKLIDTLQVTVMKGRACNSKSTLRLVIENAPMLSRNEFCQVLCSLFNCPLDSKEPRECFNRWQKSLESFMKLNNLGSNKTNFLQGLERAQMGLILDNKLDLIPFESLPIVRITNQGVFRVPSLRLFSLISARRCSPIKIEPKSVAYMLDPANNLAKTRERFEQKLRAQTEWTGIIGRPPDSDELARWLSAQQLYVFIGHGAGTAYYNKLCKGRGLNYMGHVASAAIVMGCSSGRMLSEGPRLEPFGIGWVFIFRGSPCYLGLLWDVTDNDIDKYLDSLLDKWMPSTGWSTPAGEPGTTPCRAITNVSAQARHSCQLKVLVGSTPVVYGLPIWCRN